ncbi:MAG: hypothetical protein HC851_21235 [Acaryochloris sp. RU_4_1]|nr:hypothetical protein [Acaryochloris sp. RU_4_1]NJR55933.1 hypothetical protein [Acaryochloris sp. CRU_2_0]
MKYHRSFVLILPVSLIVHQPAWAEIIELRIFPVSGPQQSCPQKVIAYQTPQPYQEGGYATNGMVNLGAIATQITLSPAAPFSAIWIGTLKPPYRNCKATAGMFSIDGKEYTGPSYLRLQMIEGKATVILDMTGLQDANGFTTQITKKTIQQGNPRWTWGGTD